mgnify:FL=1
MNTNLPVVDYPAKVTANPLTDQVKAVPQLAWKNWGNTVSCLPDYSFFPTSGKDLAEIVQLARQTRRKLRVVAQGHSWSALVPTNDILVYIKDLDKVEMDVTDPSNPLVVVESGATIKQVNDVLEGHEYALPFNVVLESVRFGGLIATGSHGSGWENDTLSDLVNWIEIVDAQGEIRRFEEGVTSEEVMNAARLHLGMFGITWRMGLKVKKSWRVKTVDERRDFDEVMQNMKEIVLGNESVDLFWWPFCEQMWVKRWNKTEASITAKPRKSWWEYASSWVTAHIGNAVWRLSGHIPPLTPFLSRLCFAFTPSRSKKVVDIVEAIHYRRCIEVNKCGCVEIAFKIDPDFANVKQAILWVKEKAEAYAQEGKFPFNVTMNLRFVANSTCWLSPAYGEGHTCYIEILSHTRQDRWEAFSAEVAQEWLKLKGAKPHWAKEFQHIPGVIDHIKEGYGNNIARFNAIKKDLGMDPEGMFMNPFLQEVF